MNDDTAHAAHDETKFPDEEQPTHPSAPAPEELAMQTWLASETRAISPGRSSKTSRFRAVAVAALEGGAARVSHVDVLEANAKAVTKAEATEATAAEATAAEPPAPERPAEPVAEPLPARSRLGPRGTVRMAVDRGPTGTVKMRRSPQAPHTERDDEAAARRAMRIRWLVVSGFALLCVFDVAWISIRAAPGPARPPAAATTALQVGQAAPTQEVPAQTAPLEQPDPPVTATPQHPGSPAAKHGRKRAAAASVF